MLKCRVEYFPDDWIKPGEFNFCNCCGYNIDLSVPNICMRCKRLTAWPDLQAVWIKSTEEFRNNLATMRRDIGLPPLFWVEK